jgi:hypothetical protein
MSTALAEEAPPSAADDLAGLPPPRRPFRRTTLAVMALTALAALSIAFGLLGEVRYSLGFAGPRDVGELSRIELGPALENRWVRGEGELSTRDVVRYSRPLDRDAYRLARVVGQPRLWVELRVPRDADGERFVPPGSFVGRLVPLAGASLRYGGLPEAIEEARLPALTGGDWLLVDGESPAGLRWSIGLVVLLVGFAVFNLLGIVHLARPVRDG